MRRRRQFAFAGVLVLGLVVGTVTIWRLIDGPAAGSTLGLPPTRPDATDSMQAPAFLEAFDLQNSVIHFTLEERDADPSDADSIADIWFDVDGDAIPARLVVRIFNPQGDLLRAFYVDAVEQTVARIEETRLEGASAGACVERGPGSPELLMQLLPFVMGEAVLEADGFVEAGRTVAGGGPTTEADDRVGEPDRTLTMPSWDDARQFERQRLEQPGQIVVAVEPESGILMGQAVVGQDGTEILFRQSMGDIHVHERGSADEMFDLQDAIDRCAEVES